MTRTTDEAGTSWPISYLIDDHSQPDAMGANSVGAYDGLTNVVDETRAELVDGLTRYALTFWVSLPTLHLEFLSVTNKRHGFGGEV